MYTVWRLCTVSDGHVQPATYSVWWLHTVSDGYVQYLILMAVSDCCVHVSDCYVQCLMATCSVWWPCIQCLMAMYSVWWLHTMSNVSNGYVQCMTAMCTVSDCYVQCLMAMYSFWWLRTVSYCHFTLGSWLTIKYMCSYTVTLC